MKTVGILAFLSLHVINTQANCATAYSGVVLSGHTIKTHQNVDSLGCLNECKKNPACRSVNYYSKTLLCQQNSAKLSEKPSWKINARGAVCIDNAYDKEFPTHDGWTLIARFSNSDAKNWMKSNGAWWYDVTTAQGDIASTTVNQDMISPAFWTVTGQEIKITRTDDPIHTALLTTNSNCLGGQTFRAKLTSYGNFRNGAVWASSKCLGSCQVTYGGKYLTTVGFKYASCDGDIQTRNKIGFWCDYSNGDGSVMMIGGSGSACGRADHGIGITEDDAAKFGFYRLPCDFGENLAHDTITCPTQPYALNLWIKQ